MRDTPSLAVRFCFRLIRFLSAAAFRPRPNERSARAHDLDLTLFLRVTVTLAMNTMKLRAKISGDVPYLPTQTTAHDNASRVNARVVVATQEILQHAAPPPLLFPFP